MAEVWLPPGTTFPDSPCIATCHLHSLLPTCSLGAENSEAGGDGRTHRQIRAGPPDPGGEEAALQPGRGSAVA